LGFINKDVNGDNIVVINLCNRFKFFFYKKRVCERFFNFFLFKKHLKGDSKNNGN